MKSDQPSGVISRRRMLKRIGVGTAVVWTVPVISSIRTTAFAASGPCETCAPLDCKNPQLCAPTCICASLHGREGCVCFAVIRECDAPACETDQDCMARCGPEAVCVEQSETCPNPNPFCALPCR